MAPRADQSSLSYTGSIPAGRRNCDLGAYPQKDQTCPICGTQMVQSKIACEL